MAGINDKLKKVIDDDEKYEIFSRALFSAKREYVYKVNEQFGSTIRHGILRMQSRTQLKMNATRVSAMSSLLEMTVA